MVCKDDGCFQTKFKKVNTEAQLLLSARAPAYQTSTQCSIVTDLETCKLDGGREGLKEARNIRQKAG